MSKSTKFNPVEPVVFKHEEELQRIGVRGPHASVPESWYKIKSMSSFALMGVMSKVKVPLV